MHLRTLPLPVIVHHLLRHVLLVTDRRSPTGLAVRAPASAHPARSIHAIWTRTGSLVACDGLLDDLLLNLGVGLCGLRRLGCRKPQRKVSRINREALIRLMFVRFMR